MYIIEVDTLVERKIRQGKMSLEELQKEEEEYIHKILPPQKLEKCSFCDSHAEVSIECCKHMYCQSCFEISQSNNTCLIESCDKVYKEAINLKNGIILKCH